MRAPSPSSPTFLQKAQTAVMGLGAIMALVMIASGLVDIYRLFEARNWAYSIAQQAAMVGVSLGRDFDTAGPDGIALDETTARAEALKIVQKQMSRRGITGYVVRIEAIPGKNGGTVPLFPPTARLISTGSSDWTTSKPSVGVYLLVPTDWVLLDLFGITENYVEAFAAAGVNRQNQ